MYDYLRDGALNNPQLQKKLRERLAQDRREQASEDQMNAGANLGEQSTAQGDPGDTIYKAGAADLDAPVEGSAPWRRSTGGTAQYRKVRLGGDAVMLGKPFRAMQDLPDEDPLAAQRKLIRGIRSTPGGWVALPKQEDPTRIIPGFKPSRSYIRLPGERWLSGRSYRGPKGLHVHRYEGNWFAHQDRHDPSKLHKKPMHLLTEGLPGLNRWAGAPPPVIDVDDTTGAPVRAKWKKYLTEKLSRAVTLGAPPARNRKEFPYEGTIDYRGLHILVENKRGSSREWVDGATGEKGSTKMVHHYGEIRRTLGPDGDPVDVYVGPDLDSDVVYVVHQMKAPDFKRYDEDKCMLGFHTAKEAKAAYLVHFNNPGFFGSMTTMSFEDFRKLLRRRDVRGKKITEGLIKTSAPSEGGFDPTSMADEGLAGAAGAVLLSSNTARGALLGHKRVYHGTDPALVQKIKQEGLQPQHGGTGAGAAVGDPAFMAASKGKVHVAPGNVTARLYAQLMGYSKKYPDMMEDIAAGHIEGLDPKKALQVFNPKHGRGGVVTADMPYELWEKFEADPHMGGKKNVAARSTEAIPPEYIRGGAGNKGQLLRQLRALPQYVRQHPARFAGGVAGTAGGAALLGYAGRGLLPKDRVAPYAEMAKAKMDSEGAQAADPMLAKQAMASTMRVWSLRSREE